MFTNSDVYPEMIVALASDRLHDLEQTRRDHEQRMRRRGQRRFWTRMFTPRLARPRGSHAERP